MTTDARTKSDRDYNVVVRWSEIDGAYLAELSDFPGVRGYGESREAAIKQVEHALELALETHAQRKWEPPRPDASLGASGQFRLRLPRQLHARLSSAASQNGVSLNQFVVSLIADALARVEQLPKNALAELREWFDVTLRTRLREALNEWSDAPQMVNYPKVMLKSKPFHSPSKWEPIPEETFGYKSDFEAHLAQMRAEFDRLATGKIHFKLGEEVGLDPLFPTISKTKG